MPVDRKPPRGLEQQHSARAEAGAYARRRLWALPGAACCAAEARGRITLSSATSGSENSDQVRLELVCTRLGQSVRAAGVDSWGRVLHEFRAGVCRGADWHDLVVVAADDEEPRTVGGDAGADAVQSGTREGRTSNLQWKGDDTASGRVGQPSPHGPNFTSHLQKDAHVQLTHSLPDPRARPRCRRRGGITCVCFIAGPYAPEDVGQHIEGSY